MFCWSESDILLAVFLQASNHGHYAGRARAGLHRHTWRACCAASEDYPDCRRAEEHNRKHVWLFSRHESLGAATGEASILLLMFTLNFDTGDRRSSRALQISLGYRWTFSSLISNLCVTFVLLWVKVHNISSAQWLMIRRQSSTYSKCFGLN